MSAFDRGYAAGHAAQEKSDEVYAAAAKAAAALVALAHKPISILVGDQSGIPDALWQLRDEAEAYADGLKAGAENARQGRGPRPVQPPALAAAPPPPAPKPASLSVSDAKKLAARARQGAKMALRKWGATSEVTAAARKAQATADSLAALVSLGGADAGMVASLHVKLTAETAVADRLLVEGPARQFVQADLPAEGSDYLGGSAPVSRSPVSRPPEPFVGTVERRTIIRV